MITYLDTNEYLKMKITTIKREVLVVEDKVVDFGNGMRCEYTLANGKLTKSVFKNKSDHVYYSTLKDGCNELLKSTWFSDFHKLFDRVTCTTEQDIFAFSDDMFSRMMRVSDSMIVDINNNIKPTAIYLDSLHIYAGVKNTQANMKLMVAFIKTLDFVEVINEGIVVEATYYNDEDYNDDAYEINKMVLYIGDIDIYKSFCNKDQSYFDRSKVMYKIRDMFLAKYPNLECQED